MIFLYIRFDWHRVFFSGASDCVQRLKTLLLAQLAEAIRLEDRSVVAQLHETLRSIRQLPKER